MSDDARMMFAPAEAVTPRDSVARLSNRLVRETTAEASRPTSTWKQKACRKLLFASLRSIQNRLEIAYDGKVYTFGGDDAPLSARIDVIHPRFFERIVLGGGLGAADSLIDGDWSCSDLTTLVRIFIRNLDVADRWDHRTGRLRRWMAKFMHRLRDNSKKTARKNIQKHYDLGNDFFELFLDPTMSYSCAVFESDSTELHQASLAKIDRVGRKLDLTSDMHVVEIGSGWGALATRLAQKHKSSVTSVTISDEQYQAARQRVQREQVEHLVDIRLQDYRDLQGKYDRLVSIEMIEAVGHKYLPAYFRTCSNLLKPEGLMVLQGIVIKDQRHTHHLQSVDFIRQYIFPGGCLPSIGSLLDASVKHTDMRLVDLEDLTPHYAETLRRWRFAFNQHLDRVREMGYTEAFIRMWEYYLTYCEAVFEERQVNLVQMVWAKPEYRQDYAARIGRLAKAEPA